MIVSCLCPTFGRYPKFGHLLEESVESFLRQRIPDGVQVELIILNDAPGQPLHIDSKYRARGVRVINLPVRLPTLGDKYNAMVEMAVGDLLLPWEDDDISLPGRIEQAVRLTPAGGYFNPQASWYRPGDGLHHDHKHGVCHNASAFSRDAWLAANGYPPAVGNQDHLFDQQLKNTRGVKVARLSDPTDPREWQYIYRWGVSDSHLSGFSDMRAAWNDVAARVETGWLFGIKPHWERDYNSEVRDYLASLNCDGNRNRVAVGYTLREMPECSAYAGAAG